MGVKELEWWEKTPELKSYYYDEWGIPEHDDNALYEILSLELLQSGLSWATILKKRGALRRAFKGFDISQVALMTDIDVNNLIQDPSIIRNRLKINAIICNAGAIQKIQEEQGSFNQYIWGFVNQIPIVNRPRTSKDIPSQTPLSAKISRDMKAKGFKFVGPVTIYSFMQGAGLVDDHHLLN